MHVCISRPYIVRNIHFYNDLLTQPTPQCIRNVLRSVVIYATMIYLWLKITVEPKYWSLIVLQAFLQTNYWLFLQFDFFILLQFQQYWTTASDKRIIFHNWSSEEVIRTKFGGCNWVEKFSSETRLASLSLFGITTVCLKK